MKISKNKIVQLDALPPFAQQQRKTSGGKFENRADSYFGGSHSRRGVAGWTPPGGDADADTLTNRTQIVNRSRDLIRNVPVATGAINTNKLHVVGSGLALQSRLNLATLGIDKKEGQKRQNIIESEWKLFANNLDCSYNRKGTFNDNLNLVVCGALESGDIFALLPYEMRNTSPYGLKIQLIESDRVCNKNNISDSVELTAGVHMNKKGAPVAYDIRTQNPGMEKRGRETKWRTIPAFNTAGRRNIIHLYEQLRPDQTRGMPYLAPIIEIVKQLSKYTNAEIASAVINSYFTVFIKSNDGNTSLAPFADQTETGYDPADKDYKMGMGAFIQLANDEDVEFADPKRPSKNFEAFVQALLRQIGAALSIPYELLNYQFSSSYSASRAAMLLAWKMFKTRRTWLETHFCNIVYESWFDEAVLLGRIDAPGYFDDFAIKAAYLGKKWVGENPGQIDPVKETKAALDRVGGRLTTIAEESAAIGGDFDQNVDQIAYEEDTMREKNIAFLGAGSRPSNIMGTASGNSDKLNIEENDTDEDDDSDDEDNSNKSTGDK